MARILPSRLAYNLTYLLRAPDSGEEHQAPLFSWRCGRAKGSMPGRQLRRGSADTWPGVTWEGEAYIRFPHQIRITNPHIKTHNMTTLSYPSPSRG